MADAFDILYDLECIDFMESAKSWDAVKKFYAVKLFEDWVKAGAPLTIDCNLLAATLPLSTFT